MLQSRSTGAYSHSDHGLAQGFIQALPPTPEYRREENKDRKKSKNAEETLRSSLSGRSWGIIEILLWIDRHVLGAAFTSLCLGCVPIIHYRLSTHVM